MSDKAPNNIDEEDQAGATLRSDEAGQTLASAAAAGVGPGDTQSIYEQLGDSELADDTVIRRSIAPWQGAIGQGSLGKGPIGRGVPGQSGVRLGSLDQDTLGQDDDSTARISVSPIYLDSTLEQDQNFQRYAADAMSGQFDPDQYSQEQYAAGDSRAVRRGRGVGAKTRRRISQRSVVLGVLFGLLVATAAIAILGQHPDPSGDSGQGGAVAQGSGSDPASDTNKAAEGSVSSVTVKFVGEDQQPAADSSISEVGSNQEGDRSAAFPEDLAGQGESDNSSISMPDIPLPSAGFQSADSAPRGYAPRFVEPKVGEIQSNQGIPKKFYPNQGATGRVVADDSKVEWQGGFSLDDTKRNVELGQGYQGYLKSKFGKGAFNDLAVIEQGRGSVLEGSVELPKALGSPQSYSSERTR